MVPDPELPVEESAPSRTTQPPRTIAVRYGHMQFVGEFNVPRSLELSPGGKVVIQSDRGIEIGEALLLSCLSGDITLKDEQIDPYVEASGEEAYRRNCGRVLRGATGDDLQEWAHICRDTGDKLKVCRRLAERHNLPMQLVECEHLFGGERIIFYFMAEGRIDFRSLVKDLASEFKTRIEMRQIGARDEARLIADYETCGQQCCCRQFLKMLKPVTMKMAKMQKATLDPSKVSGRCGRLKCCLRYEHQGYEELDRNLPRVGTRVGCAHGVGRVITRQILTQLVQIETDEGGRIVVPVDELCDPESVPRPEKKEASSSDSSRKAEARKEEAGKAESEDDSSGKRRPRSRHRKHASRKEPRDTGNGNAEPKPEQKGEANSAETPKSKTPRKGRPGRSRRPRKKTRRDNNGS